MNDFYSDYLRACRQARKTQRRGDIAGTERWTKLARLYLDLDTADKLNALVLMFDKEQARDLQRRWGAARSQNERDRLARETILPTSS